MIHELLAKANELLAIQAQSVNKPVPIEQVEAGDAYKCGMYNGMELIISMLEGREPVYKGYRDSGDAT